MRRNSKINTNNLKGKIMKQKNNHSIKKIITIAVLLACSCVYSQSIQVFYNKLCILNEDTVMIVVPHNAPTDHYLDIVNTSNDTIKLTIKRELVSLLNGAENFFDFILCYAPEYDGPTIPYDFMPGDTLSYYFFTSYNPNGQKGISLIKYTFYDDDNPPDSSSILFKFDSRIDTIICIDTIIYYFAVSCQGGSYSDSNFTNLTQAGIYCDTLQNANGCDSIICLSLYIDTVSITNYFASFYTGTTYSDSNFTNLIQAGTYCDTLHNVNGCDSIICLTLTELNAASISGKVMRQDSTFLNLGFVELYQIKTLSQYTLIDVVPIDSNGNYLFINVTLGSYIIRAIPSGWENALPTYYGDTEIWNQALIATFGNNSLTNMNITIISQPSMSGNSIISGYVGGDDEHKSLSHKSVTNPSEDVTVYLQKQQSGTWATIASTLTNAEGYFEFRNVSAGIYMVILDIPGLPMNNPPLIEITKDGEIVDNLEFEITDNGINNKTVGINNYELYITNYVVYPNPAFTQLHVKLGTQAPTDYSIYSIIGQVVLQGKVQNNSSINIESLTNGMYYLKVAGKTVKFVKE